MSHYINIISRGLNFLTFIYLILILVFLFLGKISFGYGLGDLFYAIFIGISIFIQTIVLSIIHYYVKNERKLTWYSIISFIFLIICLNFTWDFTYGRGCERPWNGYAFN